MKRHLTLFSAIILNGFVFGQISAPRTSPSKPKEIDNISTATICHDFPDHKAYFPNGKEGFTKKIENVITLESVKLKKGEKIFKAILNFIVERDGTISGIQVSGTNEKFNNAIKLATKQIKGKWVPAKENGNVLRSKMQIPIVINSH
ncbi:energy transducer TonB [Chryseobacterium formosus]|uniref:Energy transducer TonB n=1 Tax=Chryseobacterium formosus TaxID=1537363 RepID=A0ABT3XKA7_9FLAO|nr:hypothetical protein [Chryseobacterium formosus]MCX8522577.1 energy transducer TonB [Chryseobacterium formosus]